MITTHEMRLHPRPFDRIRNGEKVIEMRLNDEKRQEIKVGDHIEFLKRPDFVEKATVEVTELLRAPTFTALAAMRPPAEFGMPDVSRAERMYEYYSKEDEQKYGTLGIKFKGI